MTFDPNQFLNATVASPMSTSIPPVPEGEWKAMVDDSDKFIEFRSVDITKGARAGQSVPIATVWFNILDDKCRELAKRDKVRVKMDIWIDTTPAGAIDTGEGKNTKLGQLRAAVGQNDTSEWNFGRLRGAGPVMVKTVQRPNEKDPTNPFSEVDRVLKLG